MTTFRLVLNAILAFALAGSASYLNAEPTPAKRYRINFMGVEAGPGPYPLNKSYDRFTEGEKAILRSLYEDMPPDDEPPFPVHGFLYLIPDISRIAARLQQPARVRIAVLVDQEGNATQVRLLEYPNMEIARAVAYVLVTTKYKPARCGGAPCSQEFPFSFRLVPE